MTRTGEVEVESGGVCGPASLLGARQWGAQRRHDHYVVGGFLLAREGWGAQGREGGVGESEGEWAHGEGKGVE